MVRTTDDSKDFKKLLDFKSQVFMDKCTKKKKKIMVILRYITYGIREKVTTLGLNKATLIA
jgi:hypothetical protein